LLDNETWTAVKINEIFESGKFSSCRKTHVVHLSLFGCCKATVGKKCLSKINCVLLVGQEIKMLLWICIWRLIIIQSDPILRLPNEKCMKNRWNFVVIESDANTSVINLKLHAPYKWGRRINREPADYNWVQRKQVSIGNLKNVHETAIKDLLKLHEPFLSVTCNVTLFPSFSSLHMIYTNLLTCKLKIKDYLGCFRPIRNTTKYFSA